MAKNKNIRQDRINVNNFDFIGNRAFQTKVILFFHKTDKWSYIPLIHRLENYLTCTGLHCD